MDWRRKELSSIAAERKPFFTPEQYLEQERAAEYKSEYFSGEIFAMSRVNFVHNILTTNLVAELGRQLKGCPCDAFASNMRVKVSPTGLYTYPDVIVVCGEPQFDDTLTNPTVLIEALLPSTEAYDRGEKFAHYRRLESLREYVLVAQDKRRVERYVRQDDGRDWLLSEFAEEGSGDGVLSLASIACDLSLTDIYNRVEFEAASR